jgi:hypothetical protein
MGVIVDYELPRSKVYHLNSNQPHGGEIFIELQFQQKTIPCCRRRFNTRFRLRMTQYETHRKIEM